VRNIIVRACAIIAAWIALFTPGAFALNIDPGIMGRADISEYLNGYVHPTDCSINTGIDEFRTDACGSDNMLLESVAAGLFGCNAGEGMDKSYYVDPSTMCVAISGIKYIQAYPRVPGSTGLSFDEHICRNEGGSVPMPVPGTMFIVGLGLLGLSSLKKRNPQIMPSPEKAVHAEGNRFFPVPLHVAEAYAVGGRASVVPISIASHKRMPSKEAERYRAAMKRQSLHVRKEMAG
jgi:hypothetical protein